MRTALTLAALALPAAVLAQDPVAAPSPSLVLAEDVADAEIYTLADSYDEGFWDSGQDFGPIAANWERIGEAEDVVLTHDGAVAGVLVDVGGFLGIGDKDVLLPLEEIRLVPGEDDELVIVTRMTEEALEELAEINGLFGDD